jgi:hypothetical protein
MVLFYITALTFCNVTFIRYNSIRLHILIRHYPLSLLYLTLLLTFYLGILYLEPLLLLLYTDNRLSRALVIVFYGSDINYPFKNAKLRV